MGNFSRDPKERLNDSIAKHYVGVRMQQGVPVLDADWNELEDLRRNETEKFGTYFIGDGIPSDSDGFLIFEAGVDNDFSIREGLCIAKGKIAVNDSNVTYTTQPNFGDTDITPPIDPLTTPSTDKQFIVYLDIWEREVDSIEDPVLVDSRIGVETAIRVKREWAVRVARVPEDLIALDNPPEGHIFYQLARLKRTAGTAGITNNMMEDLRETQLSVQRKIKVFDDANNVVVDSDRFKLMLQNTRKNFLNFNKYISTQFNPITTIFTSAEILGLNSAQYAANTCEKGIALINTSSMANKGALNFLIQLYEAENNFMEIWRDFVLQLGGSIEKYASYQNLINRLDNRLHDPTVGSLIGLLPALQARNLEGATDMQEEISRLIGTSSSSIPRGSIQVFLSKSPAGILTNGQIARFEFHVKSFTTLAGTYTVSILPSSGWPRLVVDSSGNPIPNNKISIGAGGSESNIFVDVTVQNGSSDLQLRVVSDDNPSEIDQLTGLFTLTEGQAPPVGDDKVQLHISSVFNASLNSTTGNVSIQKNQTGSIEIRVYNNTGQSATFNLALEELDKVGTWNETLLDTSLLINDQVSTTTTIDVTPGNDALTMKIKITATTTISGSAVTGFITIPLTAIV